MNCDPFYRQLVKVMQECGREVTSTRQSARYKDELQTARTISSNVIKHKPKRKFKVEMSTQYSEDKVATIFDVVNQYSKLRKVRLTQDYQSRIGVLEERIAALKVQSDLS